MPNRFFCRPYGLYLAIAVLASGYASTYRAADRAPAASWPQWRGADRSGVSSDKGLLPSWPESGPTLVWKAEGLGSGFSSVAIDNGRLYTMGKREGTEYLIALDASNGKQVWSHAIGAGYENDKGGGPRGTPTVAGDRIYALGANGDLWAVSSADGKPLWHVPILETFKVENTKWGISESPLVEGNKAIVVTGNPEGSIVAFNKANGKIVWKSAEVTDEPGYASAIAVTVGGVRQIIHFTGAAAVGIRASDGKLLWRYDKAANDTANCTTPVFHNDRVFLTSGYDTGAALLKLTSTDKKTTTAEEVYFTRDMKNHHGGVVLVDGKIYGFSDKMLTCLDFETGKLLWRDPSVGKGSLTAADGMLYVLSEKGTVALVKATPEAYSEVSRFSIELGSRPSWSHPVVTGGRLYIRNGSQLLCYDVKRSG